MNFFKRLFSSSSKPASASEAEAIFQEDVKNWAIFDAINAETGEASIFRIRTCRPAYQDVSNFDRAVCITWAYESSGPFPVAEDNQRMLDFERATDDLSGFNGFSELVLVSTGMGLKEWVYYCTDSGHFMEEFNRLLADRPS